MARDILFDLHSAGGLAHRDDLLALGHSPYSLRRARASGLVSSPRRGWLALPNAPALTVRAVALGGVLGGASALESYGVWVDENRGLVVACGPSASRLPPLGPGETRVWLPTRFPHRSSKRWRVSVLDALLQFALAARRDDLIASVDSALNLRLVTPSDVARLVGALPRRLRSIAREVDGSAMSGTETHMRLALRRRGYRVDCQVRIDGIGVVDLLVDGWLILELDSRKFHGSFEQQTADRRRDGDAVLLNFGHERFMWSQVRYETGWCLAVVAARLRDGRPNGASGSAGRPGAGRAGADGAGAHRAGATRPGVATGQPRAPLNRAG
jgi:very-short-patch-repair endonuclease